MGIPCATHPAPGSTLPNSEVSSLAPIVVRRAPTPDNCGMTHRKVTVTEALLEAQVAFMAEQLGGEPLRDIVEQEVDAALAMAGKLRLHELVSRVSARRTVRRLLAEVAPGDAFAGFVVDLVVALYADKANDHTTPGDLIDEALI